MKKINRAFSSFLSALLFFAVQVNAQSPMQTVVYLKDGSIYRGNTISNTDTVIKIKTVESSVIAIRRNRVDSITTEKVPTGYIPFVIKTKGYFNVTKAGFTGGNTNYGFLPSLETVNGYRFCRLVAVGAGVGVEANPQESFFPVYLSIYSDILPGKITPFVHVDAGYSFMLNNNIDDAEEQDIFTGGRYESAGFGLSFHTRSDVNLTVGFSYCIEYYKDETTYYYYNPGSSSVGTLNESSIVFQVGFGF